MPFRQSVAFLSSVVSHWYSLSFGVGFEETLENLVNSDNTFYLETPQDFDEETIQLEPEFFCSALRSSFRKMVLCKAIELNKTVVWQPMLSEGYIECIGKNSHQHCYSSVGDTLESTENRNALWAKRIQEMLTTTSANTLLACGNAHLEGGTRNGSLLSYLIKTEVFQKIERVDFRGNLIKYHT